MGWDEIEDIDVTAVEWQKDRRPQELGAFKGDALIWCSTCGDFKVVSDREGEFNGLCPTCGTRMMLMKCTRCGHTWWPRNPTVMPGSCPRCRSPYWNRRRVR